MTSKNSNRKIWQGTWKYKEGLFISLAILLVGFSIEMITKGKGVALIESPNNIIAAFAILVLIFVLHLFFKNKQAVKWLSTIPAAVSSLSLVTFLTLLLGFTPQNDETVPNIIRLLGISHLTESWTFALALFFFQLALGLVVLRRALPLNKKNIGFLLNHAGLWITITSGVLGAGDLQRLSYYLEENKDFTNIAYNDKGEKYQIPVALKLNDFRIESYPPKLILYNNITGKALLEEGKSYFEVKEGASSTIFDWEIIVDKVVNHAIIQGDSMFVESEVPGSAVAAYIKVKNIKSSHQKEGWISSGSYKFKWVPLVLNDKYTLGMLEPEAKVYESSIEYMSESGKNDSIILQVNKPFKIEGWKLYQQGYDSEKGRWSTLSIIEAVRDPWLPVVYFGIFLLIAGSIYLFWIGNDFKNKNN